MVYVDDMLNNFLTKSVFIALTCLSLELFAGGRELTLLYTNDIESVYEPVESAWRDDMHRMGGMAHLATLIRQQREQTGSSLLLDAGDMFTGSLSKATGGRLVFDLYSAMGYDAVNLGNHEFEYGWHALRDVMPRAGFPVLNANIFFDGVTASFGQPYAILSAGDIRVGVLGAMGVDAFRNTIMRSHREGLIVEPPAEILQPIIDRIRGEVDFVVVLTHQNRTAPMQTDKESDPEVQRGFDEDYELAGTLRGVDMIIGGHSDHGLLEPVQHPETGTYIGMTFGQGMHLGYARFSLDGKPRLEEARLIPVNSDTLAPASDISRLISEARSDHPELTEVIAEVKERVARKYYRESPLGSLLADLLREQVEADLVVFPAGGIRADLEAGPLQIEQVLNIFPFTDTVASASLSAGQIRALLEKVVSLDYGLAQVSGARVEYDGSREVGDRVLAARIADSPLDASRSYRVVTLSFTATGGEGYDMFPDNVVVSEQRVADVLIRGFRDRREISAPQSGRFVDRALITR